MCWVPSSADLGGGGLASAMHAGPSLSCRVCVCVCVCVSHSLVSDSLWPHGLSMKFSRQEYWSGWPFPSPGDLPDPGIEPGSPALQAGSLLSKPPRKPCSGSELVQRLTF